jgi:hypothetical protein
MPGANGREPRQDSGTGPGQPDGLTQPVPLSVLQRRWQDLLEQNQASLTRLMQRNLAMDPMSCMNARIDCLIDCIDQAVGGAAGARWALETRLYFEQHLHDQMEEADRTGIRMQLAEGGTYTPGMISELARVTGTFRPPRS